MERIRKTKTYGLTHIAVKVRNLDRTLRFYKAVLDMEVMYREKDFIQLTTPGCNDILVFEKGSSKSIGTSGGIVHFGFRLRRPDVRAFAKKIKQEGGKIINQGEFVPGSPYIFFNDPDGYEVEVWYELPPAK